MKDLTRKFLNWNDFTESTANSVIVFGVGKALSIGLNQLTGINLDKYNSVEHAAMGIGIGTYAYRKAGGGWTGMTAAFVATTLFLGGWELIEHNVPGYREGLVDSISDMAVAYASSNILAPVFEITKKALRLLEGKKEK